MKGSNTKSQKRTVPVH